MRRCIAWQVTSQIHKRVRTVPMLPCHWIEGEGFGFIQSWTNDVPQKCADLNHPRNRARLKGAEIAKLPAIRRTTRACRRNGQVVPSGQRLAVGGYIAAGETFRVDQKLRAFDADYFAPGQLTRPLFFHFLHTPFRFNYPTNCSGVLDSLTTAQRSFHLGFGLEPVGQIVVGCKATSFGEEVGGLRDHLFARVIVAT